MRPIDAALLAAIAGERENALMAALAPLLAAEMPAAGIDTPLRIGHFLAQGCEETWRFSRLEEDLSYSAARIAAVWPRLKPRAEAMAGNPEAIANAAYAGLNGNGDEASGDGWRFRGRGLLQLTGRFNYGLLGDRIGVDLVADPDCVATPEIAVKTAVAFWTLRDCNEAADADDAGRVTRAINGGVNGLADRIFFKTRAVRALQ